MSKWDTLVVLVLIAAVIVVAVAILAGLADWLTHLSAPGLPS